MSGDLWKKDERREEEWSLHRRDCLGGLGQGVLEKSVKSVQVMILGRVSSKNLFNLILVHILAHIISINLNRCWTIIDYPNAGILGYLGEAWDALASCHDINHKILVFLAKKLSKATSKYEVYALHCGILFTPKNTNIIAWVGFTSFKEQKQPASFSVNDVIEV